MPTPFPPQPPSFRILVAEDNLINQKVISILLRETGAEVDVVSDGPQAVDAKRSKPYHLILMDLQIPVMDGWEATRRIRQLRQRQPGFVAVTADVVDGVRERCLRTGMDDYLSKPFTRDQLLAVVASAHERARVADTMCEAS
jgi:CheY-like chemotaxis protein